MLLFDTKKLRSLKAYCRDRWDISRPRVYQLIEAVKVQDNLSTIVDIQPANESQTRPLTKLDPELQKEAWIKVVETAPAGRAKASSEAIPKFFDTREKNGLHIWPVIDYVTPHEYQPIAIFEKVAYKANMGLAKI